MRRMVDYPAGQKISPPLLREAGDSTTNHTKEDDNLAKSTAVWDASSAQAHWKNRPAGQPFFAVVNSTKSHESQTIKPRATPVHDPAKVPVPAYRPDTPEVRRDWALHYDSVTAAAAGVVLAQLAADGLAEDTIIFYRADHGSGLPRSKRWPANSGLHVPLLVPIPENFQDLRPADYVAGGTTDRPVSLVDFAAHPVQSRRPSAARVDARLRLPRQVHRPSPTLRPRLSRSHGRALRPGAPRDRRPLRLPPQRPPAPLKGSARRPAAEALGQFGSFADLTTPLPVLTSLADWGKNRVFTALTALHALEALGDNKIAPARDAILTPPATGPSPDSRYASSIPRILADFRANLGATATPAGEAKK